MRNNPQDALFSHYFWVGRWQRLRTALQGWQQRGQLCPKAAQALQLQQRMHIVADQEGCRILLQDFVSLSRFMR